MEKIDNPYSMMLERLETLEQSILLLGLVNDDLRRILHKQQPLPQFIRDSFQRPTVDKSKPPVSLPPPTESEEIRLAVSVIDKAKRAIENVGEKKAKPLPTETSLVKTSVQSNTVAPHNRPKTSASTRPSSANSSSAASSNSSTCQPKSTRRYVPAHMKAPFLTQPEKKRRPISSARARSQTNLNKPTSTVPLSTSQPTIPTARTQNEQNSTTDDQFVNDMNSKILITEQISSMTTTEACCARADEQNDTNDKSSVVQPITIDGSITKSLRRLWKQSQQLRSRLRLEHTQSLASSISSPPFISRLNEKIHSSTTTDLIHLPNIEALLQLAMKLRTITLYLLENSTFDDLDSAMKRLNTLKSCVQQYRSLFNANINILVAQHDVRFSNTNRTIEEMLKDLKMHSSARNTAPYIDDSELMAFAELRFKQFENECRWIELHWHEQMVAQFRQSLSKQDQYQSSPETYRELMCLITGLQTSTPVVVENKSE